MTEMFTIGYFASGVPWNSYTWGRCLEAAYNMRRTSLLLSLLADFSRCHLEADCGPSFVSQCLPLLFDILKRKKVTPHFTLSRSTQ